MPCVYRCALLAIIISSLSTCSVAQAAASSAASSSVAPAAGVAKAAPPKKPAAKPPEKYLVEVYPLLQTFGPASCFLDKLNLPATNASDVVKLLGSKPGFTFSAIVPNKVAIYYKSATPPPAAVLQKVEDQMEELANYNQITAIAVPAGSAEKTISQLALPSDGSVVAKAVGRNCVLLESKQQVDPVALAALKKNASRAWLQCESPVTKAYCDTRSGLFTEDGRCD